MTDARFSGGSVGLVIGHVGPEAALGGPIALVEEGDTIEANLNTNELNCVELQDKETFLSREKKWKDEVEKNGGIHPLVGEVDTRLLARMRNLAVSAVYGAGMHPNGKVWVHNPRKSHPNSSLCFNSSTSSITVPDCVSSISYGTPMRSLTHAKYKTFIICPL